MLRGRCLPPEGTGPDADTAFGKRDWIFGERDVDLLVQHRCDLLAMDGRLRCTLGAAGLSGNRTAVLTRTLNPADRVQHTSSKPLDRCMR